MTAAKIRSAGGAKLNAGPSLKHLDGTPVFEDWHAKGNFMVVSFIFGLLILYHAINFNVF